jgi:hypothetical protein
VIAPDRSQANEKDLLAVRVEVVLGSGQNYLSVTARLYVAQPAAFLAIFTDYAKYILTVRRNVRCQRLTVLSNLCNRETFQVGRGQFSAKERVEDVACAADQQQDQDSDRDERSLVLFRCFHED